MALGYFYFLVREVGLRFFYNNLLCVYVILVTARIFVFSKCSEILFLFHTIPVLFLSAKQYKKNNPYNTISIQADVVQSPKRQQSTNDKFYRNTIANKMLIKALSLYRSLRKLLKSTTCSNN